jgi:tetratricopeptide (TPR) repeat protein
VSSVFAYGAGNRALALGGTFTAISDDASAPVWNPGGLGFVERRELQASGASLYGLDANEEYASIVIPSWRWGAAAFTFRRLAVNGIEHRDDRGHLFPDELTDRETEFALSYGRAISEEWSLGGSIKVRRHSLADFSGTGIGLDVGILGRPAVVISPEAPWADRLTWGLSVLNAIEPSLKHDQESSSDPVRVRTGLAYTQPLPGQMSVLAAVDLEKTKDASADVHAGLEMRVHPLLALRGGVNDGTLNAGAGIRWRHYAVDYVLEDNDIEIVHRFGVTLGFGPTVQEMQALHERAEEEKYRKRFAASFEKQRTDQVSELIRQAQAHLTAERFDEALELVAAASALAPDSESGKNLKSQVLLAKAEAVERAGNFTEASILYGRALAIDPGELFAEAGVARCRAESDRRAARSLQVQDLFSASLDAFTKGELPAARTKLGQLLTMQPDDHEARRMLNRTNQAIRMRSENLLGQAGRFLRLGLLKEAENLVEEARALEPSAKGIATMTARIRKAEAAAVVHAHPVSRPSLPKPGAGVKTVSEDQTPTSRPAVKPPVLSKKARKELETLYRRGVQAIDAGRPEDALHYWELVWLSSPDFENVADYLKREYLMRGLEAFTGGSLAEAVGYWEKALKIDPEDRTTVGYLKRVHEQMSMSVQIFGEESPQQ